MWKFVVILQHIFILGIVAFPQMNDLLSHVEMNFFFFLIWAYLSLNLFSLNILVKSNYQYCKYLSLHNFPWYVWSFTDTSVFILLFFFNGLFGSKLKVKCWDFTSFPLWSIYILNLQIYEFSIIEVIIGKLLNFL